MSEEETMGNPDSAAVLTVAKPASGGLEATEAIALAAAASAALGFPVPPTLARNVIASFGALVAATVAVPIAYLESWSQRVRTEASARDSFITLSVPLAAKALSENKEMTDRAMRFLGHRVLREQRSRETIAAGAIEDLKADPPKEDASSAIEEDWLHIFARHAETKTNADVQAYFSRVLAGEIRKPGSFSPETIEVLARITPEVGRLFQAVCGITADLPSGGAWILWEPAGDPGANQMSSLGLSYDQISRLQDAGLIRQQMTDGAEFSPVMLSMMRIGGVPVGLRPEGNLSDPRLVNKRLFRSLRYTFAGAELRRIVNPTPNPAYVAMFVEWAKRFGLIPNSDP